MSIDTNETAAYKEEQRLHDVYGDELITFLWEDKKDATRRETIHIRLRTTTGPERTINKDASVENRELSILDENNERIAYINCAWTNFDTGQRFIYAQQTYTFRDLFRKKKIEEHNKVKGVYKILDGVAAQTIALLSPFYDQWHSSRSLTDGGRHGSVHMYSHTIPHYYGHLVTVEKRKTDYGYIVRPKQPRTK